MPRYGKGCKFLLCSSRSKKHPHKKFYPFIKPWMDRERCLRWISATGREDLIPDFIDKASYVCEDHFVNGSPSAENPDPLPHNVMESIMVPSVQLFLPKSPVHSDPEEARVEQPLEQHIPQNLDHGCVDSAASLIGNPDQVPQDSQVHVAEAPANPSLQQEQLMPFETCFIKTENFGCSPGEDA